MEGHLEFNIAHLYSLCSAAGMQIIFFSKQIIYQSKNDYIDLTRNQSGLQILFHNFVYLYWKAPAWCSKLTMESFPCFTERKDFSVYLNLIVAELSSLSVRSGQVKLSPVYM